MKLRIKTFGIVSDIVHGKVIEFEQAGSTVAELRRSLVEKYPELAGLRSMMIAVNAAYAADETKLTESDEIALLPPVSGG